MGGILLVAALSPAWVDPVTLNELRDLTGAPMATPSAAPSPTPPRPPQRPVVAPGEGPETVAARDTFSRQVEGGWGSADLGGAYVTQGTRADFSVDGTSGRLLLPRAGSTGSIYLSATTVANVTVMTSVRLEELPRDGGVYAYVLVRRVASGWAYRPKLLVTPEGVVYAHAGVLLPSGEQSLGRPVPVTEITGAEGKRLYLRATATGSDPTTIRVKVWAEGLEEPGYWHFSAVDWIGALQQGGSVGLAGYLGSRTTSGALELDFGELLVTTTDIQ